MGVVLGADGGNTKTELVAARLDGEPLAYVRGPGSNSHGVGADGCADVLAALVEQAAVETSDAAKARLREELRAG